MSSLIESLDRLQKEEKHSASKVDATQDLLPKESLFSKFGILLWLGASISATVFSYHLGVNQGMQAVKSESPKEWLRYFSDFAPSVPQSSARTVQDNTEKESLKVSRTAPITESQPAVPVKEKEVDVKKQGFTIQVITYVSEKLAKEEVDRLAQKGQQAFVVPSGKYYQVCLDLFQDKKGALKKLEGLRKMESYKAAYPGAYVKFLKQ